MGAETEWIIGGIRANMITSWIRKPQYYKGKTGFRESFGTNPEDCEWIWTNQPYWQARNVGWPLEILNVGNDLGRHHFNEVTGYQSVIYSNIYKVSEGYSINESIRNVPAGISTAEFLGNIVKANENQTLTLTGTVNGTIYGNEVLEVVSADGTKTTLYTIETTIVSLSNAAILTTWVYNITFPADTAEITGFEFGTLLRAVVAPVARATPFCGKKEKCMPWFGFSGNWPNLTGLTNRECK